MMPPESAPRCSEFRDTDPESVAGLEADGKPLGAMRMSQVLWNFGGGPGEHQAALT
jgi:hypothetical protein